MKPEDVEALAREASIEMCRVLSWPQHATEVINRNSPLFLQIYTAKVIEKVAQTFEPNPHAERFIDGIAEELGAMAEGLKP